MLASKLRPPVSSTALQEERRRLLLADSLFLRLGNRDRDALLDHRLFERRILGRGIGDQEAAGPDRALRDLALGRKSWLFAGSERGAERAALCTRSSRPRD